MSNLLQKQSGGDWISRECDRFRLLSLSYRDFARSAGVDVVAFRDPDLPNFTALSEAQRGRALEALGICVRICDSARNQGHSMSDSPALVWQAIRELGLRPSSDIFSVISDRSLVEIHSPEGVQIFRNFNFFRYCSYSLEELYSLPWNTLFERDMKVMDLIADSARKVYAGEIRNATRFTFPPHRVREISSPMRNEILLDMEWIAPLYREGTQSPEATICVEAAEFVDPALRRLVEQPALHSKPQSESGIS